MTYHRASHLARHSPRAWREHAPRCTCGFSSWARSHGADDLASLLARDPVSPRGADDVPIPPGRGRSNRFDFIAKRSRDVRTEAGRVALEPHRGGVKSDPHGGAAGLGLAVPPSPANEVAEPTPSTRRSPQRLDRDYANRSGACSCSPTACQAGPASSSDVQPGALILGAPVWRHPLLGRRVPRHPGGVPTETVWPRGLLARSRSRVLPAAARSLSRVYSTHPEPMGQGRARVPRGAFYSPTSESSSSPTRVRAAGRRRSAFSSRDQLRGRRSGEVDRSGGERDVACLHPPAADDRRATRSGTGPANRIVAVAQSRSLTGRR